MDENKLDGIIRQLQDARKSLPEALSISINPDGIQVHFRRLADMVKMCGIEGIVTKEVAHVSEYSRFVEKQMPWGKAVCVPTVAELEAAGFTRKQTVVDSYEYIPKEEPANE